MWVRVRRREYGVKKSIVIQSAEDLLYFHLLIMTWSLLLTYLVHCLDWNRLSLRPSMLENGFIELPMTLKSHFPLKRHRNTVLFICCNRNIKIWLLLSLEICIHTNTIIYIFPHVLFQAFIEVPVREWILLLLRYFFCFVNDLLHKKVY